MPKAIFYLLLDLGCWLLRDFGFEESVRDAGFQLAGFALCDEVPF